MEDDPHLQRLLDALPLRVKRIYAWLIKPEARWIRWPLGVALIVGGVFGFLPVLGFWMVPLGALLIGEDIPPVRRVTLRLLGRVYRWWDAWRSPPRIEGIGDAARADWTIWSRRSDFWRPASPWR
jgi:hypothetical protein